MKSLQQPALSKLMRARYSHRVLAAIDMCKCWRVYDSNFGATLRLEWGILCHHFSTFFMRRTLSF